MNSGFEFQVSSRRSGRKTAGPSTRTGIVFPVLAQDDKLKRDCVEWLLVGDAAIAFDDAADGVALFAAAFQDGLRLLELLGGHNLDHADAHVEGAHHFVL